MASRRGRAVYADSRWRVAREAVLRRAGYVQCEACGRIDTLEVHHLDPVSARSGPPAAADYDTARLRAICRPCHWAETAAANRRAMSPAEREWAALLAEPMPPTMPKA